MNHTKFAGFSLAVLACLAGCNKPRPPSAAATSPATEAVAVVNGKPIDKTEFDAFVELLEQQAGRPLPQEQRAQALDQLINMRLLSEAADKAQLPKETKVREQLELMRLNVLSQAMAEKYVKDHPAKDEELRPAYEAQIAKLPVEYHVRHILTDNPAAAEAVIAQLKKGGDFQKLAATKSKDASKSNGGDLGWLSTESMDPSYSQAVMALKQGEYSDTPVQSKYGWHVFLLEETRHTQAPAFEDVKDRVKSFVESTRARTYVEELRKAAKVENKLTPGVPTETTAPPLKQ